ncbi:uncharacterized protein LOC114169163 [Vigna unguiculata]|uniref:Uncharacterized protein n=1 Tax=Vigna unguiculata TaxID=3917 RepID=A0A4D6LNR4_VIGUN|nr:uncharacterized protein LOC114169163 [Vigna unguiculata]QCD90113.1 hypothetical protein DEO72_LG4g1067 [Vigna unguiculata]
MASEPQNSDLTFPPADVVGELHPEINTNVQVDPSSSEMAAYKEKKTQKEAKQEKHDREKKDALRTVKSAIIISGIIVALAGAAFAIAKKLREK